jgi:death-on-curing protein
VNYLTVPQALFIHLRLITETGGSPGLRDLAMLEAAVARPQVTYGGRDLYPDLFSKAAALMESLIQGYPFVDGNKRAGITAAGLFLVRNGWRLTASNAELKAFTAGIARGQASVTEVTAWLRQHSHQEL